MSDETSAPISPFPEGLRVFFRTQDSAGALHYNTHLDGRNIVRDSYQDITFRIEDDKGKLLGIYFDAAVCFIQPLETVGPSSNEKN